MKNWTHAPAEQLTDGEGDKMMFRDQMRPTGYLDHFQERTQ